MRLIAEFQTEKEAFSFQLFLQNHGIQSTYDTAAGMSRLWVAEEDTFEEAISYYKEWQSHPEVHTHEPPPPTWKIKPPQQILTKPFSFTHFLIMLCSFFFLWYLFQAEAMVQKHGEIALEYELTPLQRQFLFDDPAYLGEVAAFLDAHDVKTEDELRKLPADATKAFKTLQDTGAWKGIIDLPSHPWHTVPDGTLFGKIREGEVWRLITPVFLHGGWLHLLFNMAWLYILGRQVEQRLGVSRYLLLSLIVGIVANVCQYLVSGPIFLGYSGIITGLVGFIWMRQKKAPWEGYPLPRAVIVFIAVFVLIMFILELLALTLQYFHVLNLYPNIANAAHIIGAVTGILLARLSFFARKS